MSTHSPRLRTRSVESVPCEYSQHSTACATPLCACARTPLRAHIPASRHPRRKLQIPHRSRRSRRWIARAHRRRTATPRRARQMAKVPFLLSSFRAHAHAGTRVLGRCTLLPAPEWLRCVHSVQRRCADSAAKLSHAAARRHRLSSKAEPSTDTTGRPPRQPRQAAQH